uniref:Inner membrane transport protein yjjL n=1 Tax=Rhizophora mucronata TaxID=61149 RepID=A0A2P2M7A6_RHIMU
MRGGAKRSPLTLPTLSPPKTNATARERSSKGIDLAIRSVAADGETPSPIPTKILEKISPGINPAREGRRAVANDQVNTPISRTFLPPRFLANQPPGN